MKMVKEIRSKTGELHFRRYAIFECFWFNIYLHRIFRDDQDKDPHNHPWNFWSIILWGAFIEDGLHDKTSGIKSVGTCHYMSMKDYHKNRVISTVTTLVLTGKRSQDWGYMTKDGYVGWEEYRENKNDKIEKGKT
jgi:hypothetical protein